MQEWAKNTGKYREGVDTPRYARWKTRLRCAFNKAPDIVELSSERQPLEPEPYRVYQFRPVRGKVGYDTTATFANECMSIQRNLVNVAGIGLASRTFV